MGRKRVSGLRKRGETWHIEKQVFGRRIYESTGSSDLKEAEQFLARRTEELRQAIVYGVRPKRSFKEAAIKFLQENQHKASIKTDAGFLKLLAPYIGNLSLEMVHMGALQTYIQKRRAEGRSTRTINYGLQVVRRILNLAATEWMDEFGLTWLLNAPKIKLLPDQDKRDPYPLNWEEQARLFKELPAHLHRMALFAVNSGCRDGEICNLRWEWEIRSTDIPGGSVFLIPKAFVKNRHDRLVVLNETAHSVVEHVRGQHPEYVFTYRDKPLLKMLTSSWKRARLRAGLSQVRVHDLKHTFGRRLRAAGVSFEDRQDLLGHKSSRITTHYSDAEIRNLYEAANLVVSANNNSPTLVLLKRIIKSESGKTPADKICTG